MPHSWSANRWATGDYYQFSVNLGSGFYTYSDITASYDQNGSSTGPETFYFAYSTDGSTFTKFGSDYGLASGVTWSFGTPNQGTQLSFDLSSITALNTASTIYFRVVEDSPATGGAINGGNIATTGTDQINNFLVSGALLPVPEPAVLQLSAVGMAAFLAVRRRK